MQDGVDALADQQVGKLGRTHIHAMKLRAEPHQMLQMVEHALGGVAQIIDNAHVMTAPRQFHAGV